MIINNASAKKLTATLTLSDASGNNLRQELTIQPSQTVRLDLRQLTQSGRLNGLQGGVTVSFSGNAGSVNVSHLVFDDNTGLTAIMKTFDRKGNDTARQHTMRAPMMALIMPDPVLAFPAGISLVPQVFLRNATSSPLSASATLDWRSATTSGRLPIALPALAPNEIRTLNLGDFSTSGQVPADATWGTITASYQGRSGDLVPIAVSYNSTGRYGLQTPFSEETSRLWKGSMWHVDPTHNTLITTGNAGTTPTHAAMTLFYDAGKSSYTIEKLLQPGEQLWADLGQIIRNQLPDKSGIVIPPVVMNGSYELRDLDNIAVGTLYEGKLVLDKTWGHGSYGCSTCCGYRNTIFNPNPFTSGVGTGTGIIIWGRDCAYTLWDITNWALDWGSTNTSVATVSGAYASLVGVGTASGFADFTLQSSDLRNNCPESNYRPAGVMNAQAVSVSLGPSTVGLGGQSTVTATLQPAASGQSVTLQVGEVVNSGGHQHSGRPVGTLASSSGITDANGSFSTTYTATQISGNEVLTATISGISNSATATVAVSGLQILGSGTNYNLVGSTTRHPTNHYGTAGANAHLVDIANQYAAVYASSLNYNDQSLIQGGLFDIFSSTDWSTPHAEHRLGTNCDVSKGNVPNDRWATLQTIFVNNGSPNYLDEGDHWHLRF